MVISKPLLTTNLGGIFEISKEDFKHINARVSSCITSKAAVEVISRSLPPFRAAVAAAIDWKESLYPELIALARDLDVFAAKAISDFSAFKQKVDELDSDDDDFPIPLKDEMITIISSLHARTTPMYQRFENVTSRLFNFITANTALDIAMASKKLGFEMKMITDNLNRLQEAAAHVRGGWQGLSEELRNYEKIVKTDIDLAYIAGLSLGAAIKGWEKLRIDCSRFLGN